jgi:hypothetical protein
MSSLKWQHRIMAAAFAALLLLVVVPVFAVPSGGQSGTTLAAVKTIDICDNGDGTWTYSGDIAVWNSGAATTQGLAIQDCIQNKSGGGQFQDVPSLCGTLTGGQVTWVSGGTGCPTPDCEIPGGTDETTATLFHYSISGAPLAGDIRNIARITITNHSGHLGTAFGPEPKATYDGPIPPPPCNVTEGCTHTIGYWCHKPGVEWPTCDFEKDTTFFLSGMTYGEMVCASESLSSSGYYKLGRQYVAALLNQCDGASTPSGVQDIITLSTAWFAAHVPGDCPPPPPGSACSDQKTWAGILDDYNNGNYQGGPPHCDDEE